MFLSSDEPGDRDIVHKWLSDVNVRVLEFQGEAVQQLDAQAQAAQRMDVDEYGIAIVPESPAPRHVRCG